jgi:hypothetical protein
MSTVPDKPPIESTQPVPITVSTPVPLEALSGTETDFAAAVEATSGISSERGVAYETRRDFRLLSTEGVVYGAIVLLIGLIVVAL